MWRRSNRLWLREPGDEQHRSGEGSMAMSRTLPGLEPLTITADVDERVLRVEWNDGHQSVYDFEHLRWACPCATCRGEWGQPGALDYTNQLSTEQTEIEDIAQVGRYAICPIWADGHSTGIYTYAYLRGLCQCASCSAERGARNAEQDA